MRAPADLILVGRDLQKTEQVAADLRVRSPESLVESVQADFIDTQAIQSLIDQVASTQNLDIALIAHGSLPDQEHCQTDLTACQDALMINAVSPALFAEAIAGHMEKANQGSLAILGSVAGDRGRKSNYVYGSAKGLVTRYAQGLQHRLAKTRGKVTLIKPGPTDTPMTAHLKAKGMALAPVEEVAQAIVKAIDKGRPVAYVPAKWALIMMVIRHLPSFVFNKMDI